MENYMSCSKPSYLCCNGLICFPIYHGLICFPMEKYIPKSAIVMDHHESSHHVLLLGSFNHLLPWLIDSWICRATNKNKVYTYWILWNSNHLTHTELHDIHPLYTLYGIIAIGVRYVVICIYIHMIYR